MTIDSCSERSLKKESVKKLVIIGAGKIGSTIYHFLKALPDNTMFKLEVSIADNTPDNLTSTMYQDSALLLAEHCDFQQFFQQHHFDAVINAGPYSLSIPIADAAQSCGLSYFDLTEDVESCQHIQKLAKNSLPNQIFIPQCGLAPGFISILARSLYDQFESLESVQLRVGALPQFPTNQMLYNLTWSTSGLVNEYCNLCESIEQGQQVMQAALYAKEVFSLEGIKYEAFNTSGGLGTLTQTLAGKVEQLNYKTVRYPGHRDLMKFLLKDLKFQHPDKRSLLVQLLDTSIPVTAQDVVLIMVTVAGTITNAQGITSYQQLSELKRIYHQKIEHLDNSKQEYSAIQVCTAASICAVIELWLTKQLAPSGFIHQEDILLEQFYRTHYGKYLL